MASDCARVYERIENAGETGFFDLSECKLTQIPNGVFMVLKSNRAPDDPPITRCSLAKNMLKNFPPKLVREDELFGDLESLDVSSNKLTQLPSEIESMKKLTEMNLSGNKFEYLPEIVWSLPKMKSVNLAGNLISGVDVGRIREVEGLTRLDLSGNPLADDVKTELAALAEEKGILLCL